MEKRLLIIEDSKDILEIISVVLLDIFDTVDTAATIDEAVNALTVSTYSLIFLDINLSNRNGAEVIKFLIEAPNNSNKNTPFVIMSGCITPDFVDRYQNRFAGILMKPFEHDDIRKITEEIMTPQKRGVGDLEQISLDEIQNLKCSLPFPVVQLDQRVNKILEQVKKSAKLNQLFSGMKIDRGADNYFLTHIGMLVNICTAICVQLEWDSDKTLEKFVYAAYLHDMALVDRLDLIRIDTFETLESRKDTLSQAEYKLVFEHANIAANNIKDIPGIPADVDMIIRQHHELPKRTGFPTMCGYPKIIPTAAVFIIAHDLTEYILSNPKWNPDTPKRSVETYISNSVGKFQGSHFTKILRSFSKME